MEPNVFPVVDLEGNNKGPTLMFTHEEGECGQEHCTIHNPSHHHMMYWPMAWITARGTMDRECPHGIRHPDPDDLAFLTRVNSQRAQLQRKHLCDGCCVAP